jgi:hypothetical protein
MQWQEAMQAYEVVVEHMIRLCHLYHTYASSSETCSTKKHNSKHLHQIANAAAHSPLFDREELGTARDRLLNGLSKLNETNQLVDKMKTELAALQPVLEAKAASTAELLQRVTVDQQQAEEVKVVVAAEEADVKIMQQKTQVKHHRTILKAHI